MTAVTTNKKKPLFNIGTTIKNTLGGLFAKKNVKSHSPENSNRVRETKTPSTAVSSSLSDRPAKPFNIQLSEDDKDVYNLNEDEEEEEEDEYEEEEIDTTQQPQKTPSKEENQPSNRSESIPVYLSKEEDEKTTENFLTNPILFCHRIRKKGSFVSLDEIEHFTLFKMKKKKSLLTRIGIGESGLVPIEYVMFFEENYFYLAKNIIVDKSDPNIRKVGNKYSFYQITNISLEEDVDKKTILRIEMVKENNKDYFSKEFFLDSSKAPKLLDTLNKYFKALNLDTSTQTNKTGRTIKASN